MLQINDNLSIPLSCIELNPMRSQGAGGQNVNKVSSAIHLRFDIKNSLLPEYIIQKLLNSGDSRITLDGVLILKSQQFRTQEKNREAALERLKQIIILASQTLTPRRPTRPTRNSQIKRLDTKTKQARTKALRKNNSLSDY